MRSLPGALGRGNDFGTLRLGDSAGDVVKAVHRVENETESSKEPNGAMFSGNWSFSLRPDWAM